MKPCSGHRPAVMDVFYLIRVSDILVYKDFICSAEMLVRMMINGVCTCICVIKPYNIKHSHWCAINLCFNVTVRRHAPPLIFFCVSHELFLHLLNGAACIL